MRALIQVPSLNEEADIKSVISEIPRTIPGISKVEVLLIDDGSEDNTVAFALEAGADVILSKRRTRGLAHSFRLGQAYFLSSDYDLLINLDGDNQYFQNKIADLVRPIIAGEADLVIGDRKPSSLSHFSHWKRILQRLGSQIVSYATGVKVPDAASGFRAYSKLAASKLFITTRFSYAMESVIQAGNKGLRVVSIETGARKVTRPSRLFRSTSEHVFRSGMAILKSFLMYRPVPVFSSIALLLFVAGLIPMVRYLVLNLAGVAGEHLQSLILGSLLITSSAVALLLGLSAELSRIHRELFEEERSLDRLSSPPKLEAILANFSADLVFAGLGTQHGSGKQR
jgi:glycosyltransferase involved in cell wall biosynthesis